MVASIQSLSSLLQSTKSLIVIFGFLTCCSVFYLICYRHIPRKASLCELPGPKLVPFIGRIHDLPIQYMWLKFKEWADQYGPVYRTKMLDTLFIVVSDESIAEELLVRRAKINSDRPGVKSLFDSKSTSGSMEYLPLMGRNSESSSMVFKKFRSLILEYWSRQRRWAHASLTEASTSQWYGIVDHEAKRWLYRLLIEPESFLESLEDMASKVTCTMAWDDHTQSIINTPSAWGLLTQMSPAGPITNLMTPLWDYIPERINPWRLAEHKRHDEQQEWWMNQFIAVRRRMQEGTQRPCWAEKYLRSQNHFSGDYEASSAIGMLALVGVFTVGGPLHYFLMAMVHHPVWLARAQQEVDCVCKASMPTVSDKPMLPVLRACIKETMRWRPNVPTGELANSY